MNCMPIAQMENPKRRLDILCGKGLPVATEVINAGFECLSAPEAEEAKSQPCNTVEWSSMPFVDKSICYCCSTFLF
jgi:hypothetical protein